MKSKNLLTVALLMLCVNVFSLDPTKFTINRITAPYFIVDGNSTSTITSAYVGFEVINNSNSGVTYNNLVFTITSITSNVAGQTYSLVSTANGIKAVGTLAPGTSRVCYFYVNYPASVTPQGTFNVTLSDATASSKTASFVIRNRSCISANAGGAAIQTFTNQDIIGGIITDDVTYTVGNVQNGDETDFQVAVTPQFDPTKMSLISTRVTASTVPLINSTSTDSLYFISGNGSNGASVTIRWTFRITGYNFTNSVLPCAGATSGNTNYKYALNTSLGAGTPITISASANPLTITKTSDQSVYLINSTAKFTVTINNPGAYDVVIDKITDNIPAGFTYVGIDGTSDVTSVNSTSVPASSSTGLITFTGGVISGANTSYRVPAGGNIKLVYTATAPAIATTVLTTTAKDFVEVTEVGSADNSIRVATVLPVRIVSFTGTKTMNNIKLNWQTSDEINTGSFEIEKMNSLGNFDKLGIKTAAGRSNTYDFTDVNPFAGENTYRLKTLDNDGRFSYSKVINVSFNLNSIEITGVYPNPFNDHFVVSVNAEKDQMMYVALIGSDGRCIKKQHQLCKKGSSLINMQNLDALNKGMYILRITSDNLSSEIKLIKN